MSVGEAFSTAGQVYIIGFAIALGMAALIKLIRFWIDRSERKEAEKREQAERKAAEI